MLNTQKLNSAAFRKHGIWKWRPGVHEDVVGLDESELRYDDLGWSWDQASKHKELSHLPHSIQLPTKLVFVTDSFLGPLEK